MRGVKSFAMVLCVRLLFGFDFKILNALTPGDLEGRQGGRDRAD